MNEISTRAKVFDIMPAENKGLARQLNRKTSAQVLIDLSHNKIGSYNAPEKCPAQSSPGSLRAVLPDASLSEAETEVRFTTNTRKPACRGQHRLYKQNQHRLYKQIDS